MKNGYIYTYSSITHPSIHHPLIYSPSSTNWIIKNWIKGRDTKTRTTSELQKSMTMCMPLCDQSDQRPQPTAETVQISGKLLATNHSSDKSFSRQTIQTLLTLSTREQVIHITGVVGKHRLQKRREANIRRN